ncbi:MAG: hypothetical protein HY901_21480 [Deltaproteobacteria bacterium]|nr:hypothetical protein [Deltaproteobacteria bacterium]
MIALALLTVLAAAPGPVGFVEAPAIEVWASEDWPSDLLAAAGKLPKATLGLAMRTNMLRPADAALLRKGPSLVRLQPSLAPAHVDQLRKLTRTTLVVPLAAPLGEKLGAELMRLGPQPLRIVLQRLDAPMAASLRVLKNAEVELDIRGRVPDQEELGLLLGLGRLRRVVRLRADAPVALISALKLTRPVRLVVESVEGRVPEAMTSALLEAGLATRVAVDLSALPDDLKRLAPLPQITLELALSGDPEAALPRARSLLGALLVGP